MNMKHLKYFNREECSYCRSKNISETIPDKFKTFSKGNVGVWKTSFLRCNECDSFFNKRVPTKESMIKIYKNQYHKQDKGLKRFKSNYGEVLFKNNVLEVGGGTSGVKDNCENNVKYINIEISNTCETVSNLSLTTSDVESLTPEDIEKLKSCNIDNIVCCDVIEHLLYPYKVFLLASKVLNKGGMLYVTFGEYISLDDYNSSDHISVQSLHINIVTIKTILMLCEKFNFNILSDEMLKDHCFIFKKAI